MSKKLLLLIIIMSSIFSYSQQINYQRILINNPNLKQLTEIGIDLQCGAILKNNQLQLELSEYELEKISNSGMNYQILIKDLTTFYSERAEKNLPQAISELNTQKTIQYKSGFGKSSLSSVIHDNIGQHNGCEEINWATPTNFKLGSMGGCFTVSEALAELDLMRSLYPNLISVKTDASPTNQKTVEGRTTYYVRISDNPDIDESSEPETLYTGMTHSRELSSLMNLMYYMWYLLENYNSDPAIKNLLDNQALYFIPIVNSDGLAFNESIAPNGGGLQRKNRNIYNGGCNTTSEGVDLNRNFGYYWNNGGSSSNTCSETYRGPNYFSEPESQIVRDFFLQHDFELVLNHHSFKNAMLHGYAGVNPSDLDAAGVDRREDEFAKYNHDMTHFNRYAYGPSTQISALNSGNTNDWMMGPASAGSTGGPGAGKHTMAWTPENGLSSEANSSSGFWPDPLLIDDIARRALRANFLAAYYSGKYAKLIDLTPSNISSLSGNLDFGIEFLGQKLSSFTVEATPISANISSITNPTSEVGMATLEQRKVSVNYTLNGSIQPNEAIEYKVSLSNDNGILYEANITKYYNPTLLFSDNPDVDGITNWTASGGSWGTTTDAYSGTTAITDSPSGSYSNSQSKTLQLNNSISTLGLTQTVIQYYAKWDLERSFDYVQIEASSNGSTWAPLCTTYSKPGAPNANNSYSGKSSTNNNFQPDGEQLYDGDTQDKWVMEEILIDTNENNTFHNQNNVYLRFNFNSDSSNNQDSYTTTFDGFTFDDFKVITNTTNISQNITFDTITDKNTTDLPFQLNASASSGLPISYSILSGPASINGDTITLSGTIGTVIVRASQAGDATYNAAIDVNQSFEVITPACLIAPSGLSISNIETSSATLSWDFVSDATYEYQFRAVGSSIWTTNSTSNNSVNISGLVLGTQYEVQVRNVCSDSSTSSFSSIINFTTSSSVTLNEGYFETGLDGWTDGGNDVVRYSGSLSYEGNYSMRLRDNSGVSSSITSPSLNLSSFGQVSLDFHFYANSMENGEDIWLRYNDGSGWTTITTWASGSGFNNNSFNNVTFILDESQYNLSSNGQFRIQCDASQNNDQVYIDQIIIIGTPTGPDVTNPSSPTNLSASNTSETTTDLSWNASTDNIGVTGYDIYQDGVFINNVSGTSYQVSGLNGSTTYSFYIRAKDAAGNESSNSNTVNITTLDPPDSQSPSTPTNLSSSNTTYNSTDLSWMASTDNVGVTGYDIYQNGAFINNTSETNFQVTGLNPSTLYSFYVIAKDAAGNSSSSSNIINITTEDFIDTIPPSSPSNLNASNTTETTTDLSWNASTDNVGVTGYDIYQNNLFVINTSGTSFQITGLTQNTSYSFYVIARDAAGLSSGQSNIVNETTLAAPTCNDGIQNGDETGIDCGGSSCVECPPSDTILHEGYFETGLDGWTDGGKDASRYSGSLSYEGSFSMKLRDNSGTASSISSPLLNLSPFNQIEIDFHFYANSMENGEDIWLRYNDGSGWTTVATWASGSGFNNNSFNNVSFTLDSSQYNFISNGQFRIQCDASAKNDNVYIDQVIITGKGSNLESKSIFSKKTISTDENVFETKFLLFPNPVNNNILNIRLSKISNIPFRIINSLGQIVKTGKTNQEIKLDNLKSGVYIIEVKEGNKTHIKKFIKN